MMTFQNDLSAAVQALLCNLYLTAVAQGGAICGTVGDVQLIPVFDQ